MLNNIRCALVSNGLLRAPLQPGIKYSLKVKSYYNQIEFILHVEPRVDDAPSPQALYVARTLLRGLMPNGSTDTAKLSKTTGRTIQIPFVYNAKDNTYTCKLERSLETYCMYRSAASMRKDEEQGL